MLTLLNTEHELLSALEQQHAVGYERTRVLMNEKQAQILSSFQMQIRLTRTHLLRKLLEIIFCSSLGYIPFFAAFFCETGV